MLFQGLWSEFDYSKVRPFFPDFYDLMNVIACLHIFIIFIQKQSLKLFQREQFHLFTNLL